MDYTRAFTTPDDLRYGDDDMWARQERELLRVGITDFGQSQLGDIIFVDVPKVEKNVVARSGDRGCGVDQDRLYSCVIGKRDRR